MIQTQELEAVTRRLSLELRRRGIPNRVDNSAASIGKRYARNDELGTPFGITVDFDTIEDGSLTLRDRDTTRQVRTSEEGIFSAIENVLNGEGTWEDIEKRFPAFDGRAVNKT